MMDMTISEGNGGRSECIGNKPQLSFVPQALPIYGEKALKGQRCLGTFANDKPRNCVQSSPPSKSSNFAPAPGHGGLGKEKRGQEY